MTKSEVVGALRMCNPYTTDAELVIYASAFLEHRAAQAHIDQNGTILKHPKTEAPFENPYLSIRDRTARVMLKLALKTGDLWR